MSAQMEPVLAEDARAAIVEVLRRYGKYCRKAEAPRFIDCFYPQEMVAASATTRRCHYSLEVAPDR